MGSKCSIFANKSKVEIEIRVFAPPARPDRYKKIIRVKPGETMLLRTTKLGCQATNLDEISLMVFLDNVYSGVTFYTQDIEIYAKILGYVDDNGRLRLKGIRFKFPSLCMFKYAKSLNSSMHFWTVVIFLSLLKVYVDVKHIPTFSVLAEGNVAWISVDYQYLYLFLLVHNVKSLWIEPLCSAKSKMNSKLWLVLLIQHVFFNMAGERGVSILVSKLSSMGFGRTGSSGYLWKLNYICCVNVVYMCNS